MKAGTSVVLAIVFLLQTFATAIAMPVNQMMPVIEQAEPHACCKLEKENSAEVPVKEPEKKNCCAGDAYMSCCVVVISLEPLSEVFDLYVPDFIEKGKFSYQMKKSEFIDSFFHPPQFV